MFNHQTSRGPFHTLEMIVTYAQTTGAIVRCINPTRHHARTHVLRSGHSFTLNVKRTPKQKSPSRDDQEPPAKMTKLAIVEQPEEDQYEYHTSIKCWKCNPISGQEVSVDNAAAERLKDGVMRSLSSARQSEVKAWEEEIVACEHTLTLGQSAAGSIPPEGLAHCASCELTSNLWLCLTCGALGCGRKQYGDLEAAGGNGHALGHFNSSKHPVCVKLGTITPEGNGDIYCYACDDSRLDPYLATHLANFGINVKLQTKTEKSITELQIDQNMNFDFSLTTEDGHALMPVSGPGLTGLRNLGNSCGEPLPAGCLECQMFKLADGLLSGRYSDPYSEPCQENPPSSLSAERVDAAHSAPENVPFQAGLKPAGFKALVGKGHAEFATMRQQDAQEFLQHLLTVLRRFNHKANSAEVEPTEALTFGLEQRLQCLSCNRVRYRVDIADVLSFAVPAKELPVESDSTAESDKKTRYHDVQLTPDLLLGGIEGLDYKYVLVLHAKKFKPVNWVPTKLDIPVILPEGDVLVLDKYLGHGLQPGEVELPEAPAAAPPQFDETAMQQLEAMGFPTIRCQKALLATGNSDAEAAMEWLFAHMEDPDIDAPIQLSAPGANQSPEPPAEQVEMLADMGFTPAQARKALRETGNNAERAVEWLFNHPDDTGETSAGPAKEEKKPPGSRELPARYRLKAFISHKGPSVHSGHYVAHIRDPGNENNGWVLFNDEKVVVADEESVEKLKKLAYIYFFERI
ncbi:hypothetical protein ID866_5646 [Astraeus odoratus]|nr:hypothetical protein ID866_5646 [Astraeus odoratus]